MPNLLYLPSELCHNTYDQLFRSSLGMRPLTPTHISISNGKPATLDCVLRASFSDYRLAVLFNDWDEIAVAGEYVTLAEAVEEASAPSSSKLNYYTGKEAVRYPSAPPLLPNIHFCKLIASFVYKCKKALRNIRSRPRSTLSDSDLDAHFYKWHRCSRYGDPC